MIVYTDNLKRQFKIVWRLIKTSCDFKASYLCGYFTFSLIYRCQINSKSDQGSP